ncbi:sensor histidine kinase [Thalassobacillus sp. CUG 92003]|uniref:sensor histidine kinase n=1 Tax=Thalassobacillus sp. CUG 92003 TaxID=2736641 RepID=UPI0015E7B96D|nr:sensor histidine kinase [Thalassobacillus sp. CUG 92003]
MQSLHSLTKNRTSTLLFMMMLPSVYLFFGPYDQKWAIYVLLFAALVICYWKSISQSAHRKTWILLQLVVVALIGSLYSPWSLALAFYPALTIGLFLPERFIRRFVGLMVMSILLSLVTYHVRQGEEWHFYWLPVVAIIMGLPFIVRMYRRTSIMNEELKMANEEIKRLIKNEERERISRDLHDSIGHTLSLITLKSELMERLIRLNPDEAIEEAKVIQSTSRSVLLQIRELINDMQAVDLEDELQHAVETFEWANITFHQRKRWNIKMITPITRNILGMCLRECITNVLKHSRATNCTVTLDENESSYTISVEDDGEGFSTHGHHNFGSGLHGMNERLLLIGGTLHLQSGSEGTNVSITVPKM